MSLTVFDKIITDRGSRYAVSGGPARTRAEAEALSDRLSWVVGDAMALPFAESSFDVYTISFGIRNVTRIEAALAG